MKALAQITAQQSIEEIFIQELDQIYYPGYAEEIMNLNPQKLEWELKEYQSQFSVRN